MLFGDLNCSESKFQSDGTATEKTRFPVCVQPWEQTTSKNKQMKGVPWAWVQKKTWKIDMNVLHKKQFDRSWCKV